MADRTGDGVNANLSEISCNRDNEVRGVFPRRHEFMSAVFSRCRAWSWQLTAIFSIVFISGAQAQVVISQVWGGGGVTGVPNADYVELFNVGSSPVDLSGWSVQCATNTGAFGGATSKIDIPSGTIQPHRYFLVRVQAPGTGNDLPTPDVAGSGITALLSSGGKVALCNTTALLPATPNPLTCAEFTTIVDFVGYGTTTNVREPCSSVSTSNNAPGGVQTAP